MKQKHTNYTHTHVHFITPAFWNGALKLAPSFSKLTFITNIADKKTKITKNIISIISKESLPYKREALKNIP